MELKSDFRLLATDERFIQDTKEIIKNDLFYEDTSNFMTIVPGIKGGQQVAAMKGFEYVTKASAGCGGDGISPEFPAFSQTWNPKLQEVKLSYCYDDFLGHYTQWALANGYAIKDLGQTEMAMFIQDLVVKAMRLDLQRMTLLSDQDILTQGVLTDDAAKGQFYNTIDKGLIPTLQYLRTLPEFEEAFSDIEQNAETTTAAQMSFESEDAVNIYEDLILEAYDFDGNHLLSSNKLALSYDKWLRRGNGYGVERNIDSTTNGVQAAKVSGYPVTPIKNYDRWKKNDFTQGGAVHLPHFAFFGRKEDLQIGVDSDSALEDLTFEYIGGKEETFWIKGNYMLDFKMVNPYAMRVAL